MNHIRMSSLMIAALMGLCTTTVFASAPEPKPGSAYWRDSQGVVVRDGAGHCVRSGYFTPALATEDCDPQLVKKPVPPPAPKAAPVAPAPAPMPKATLPAGPQIPIVAPTPQALKLSADTLFDFDQSALKPEGQAQLKAMVEKARGATIEQVRVEGHTDSIGTQRYNQKLSERRADAVKAYLVQQGLSPAVIVTESFGEDKPIATNKTREGRAQNRRVEVELLGSRLNK
ncbi:MAG: hypothetical protein RL320_1219 [Pseudomonadota bacterium]